MFKEFNPADVLQTIKTWLGEHLMTPDTFFQFAIIVGSFMLGGVGYRLVRKRMTDAIDNSKMPIRAKRTFNNLKKLAFPCITLAIMFVASQIAGFDFFNLDFYMTDVVMKLLLAWVVIRLALQFMGNPAIRNIFALSIWVIAALSIFGILDKTTMTLDAIGFNIGDFRLSALAVIKSLLSLFILLYLALFASTFVERRVLKSKSLTRSSQVLIAKILRISLIVIAVLIGLTSAGIDLSIFAVLSGAIGLGIGFGLQKVVSNLFSGLLLLMDKSITPGDVIEIQDSGTFGWVNHMGARYTEIITRDNKSYLIPNEDFVTQRVINWSHGSRLIRLETKFGVHYDSDPHQVIAIAKEAAKRPERVVDDREPVCWITEFGDNSINLTLRFWIKDAEGGVSNVTGEVLLALWDALKENNIKIPYPHREVYIHQS